MLVSDFSHAIRVRRPEIGLLSRIIREIEQVLTCSIFQILPGSDAPRRP